METRSQPMNQDCIIDEKELEHVKNKALFYPCSGNDLLTPINIFSPFITDFWFIDRGYFSPNHQDTRRYGGDRPADEQTAVLAHDRRYRLIDVAIDGQPSWPRTNPHIAPCVLTEAYLHRDTARVIRVHRRRGYGFSAFRNDHRIPKKLGVFFYRGDSCGEGGSGNLWLKISHLTDVFHRLDDDGLLALDGSDGARYFRKGGVYKPFWKYQRRKKQTHPNNPGDLVASSERFEDDEGRQFTCVGYAGYRYGPTLIWRVRK